MENLIKNYTEMKKNYKKPMMETTYMVVDAHLLQTSNTATNAGVSVEVDEWEED